MRDRRFVAAHRAWQVEQLPDKVRELIVSAMERRQTGHRT